MSESFKTYLGDGVYVDCDRFGCVVLTTEDGISVTNRVVLEPEVALAFESWFSRLKAVARESGVQ